MRKVPYPYVRDKELKDEIDKIMHQLEKHGRAITNNKRVLKVLAWKFKPLKMNGDLRFVWDKHDNTSILVLKPGARLEPTTPNKKNYKLYFREPW